MLSDLKRLGDILLPERASRRKAKVAFFAYSWHPSGRLDAYLSELVSALSGMGLEVSVFLGNQFSERLGIRGFSPRISKSRLLAHLRREKYDFAISINNSMIMPEVVEALGCRITTVLVDGVRHLFNHVDAGDYDLFSLDIEVSSIFSSILDDVEKVSPEASPRLHLIAPATNPQTEYGLPKAHQISWVASLVGDHNLDAFLSDIATSPEHRKFLNLCLLAVKDLGRLTDDAESKDALRSILDRSGWDFEYFEMQLQNIVTNSERIEILERLGPHGLKLYGNARWRQLLPYSLTANESIIFDGGISTHAQLMEIYNSSRICVNLPQSQVRSAIQYRVADILASQALLITKFNPDSDLFEIFGKDCPVVFFRTMQELEDLCVFYLENEDERLEMVRKGNALVSKGFSFKDRAADYLKLSNPSLFQGGSIAFDGVEGEVKPISAEDFTNWVGRR